MSVRYLGLILAIALASCIQADSSLQRVPVELIGKQFSMELKRHGLQGSFTQFQEKIRAVLEKTNRQNDPEDHAGNARLKWVNQVLETPADAVLRSEQFSRETYDQLKNENIQGFLSEVSRKLDAEIIDSERTQLIWQHKNPFDFIGEVIDASKKNLELSFLRLSKEEKSELRRSLYRVTTGDETGGFRFSNKEEGLRLVELLKRVDRKRLLLAAEDLTVLTDPRFLKALWKSKWPSKSQFIKERNCKILLGSRGPNLYRLDQWEDVCAIIDPGGNDRYIEGSTTEERPLLVIIDLNGDDNYQGREPGIQGGAILGGSLIIDLHGNDRYIANDVSQGSSLAGFGILIDKDGNDFYQGDKRTQGQAIAGIGLLLDQKGDDRYRGALFAQGVGGTLGFGLLADLQGEDHYFAGGKYADSYEDTPGFGSWSQGIGAGARGVADGGIGMILDASGNDIYEADYFSHGGGYWFATGIARDFSGDDLRIGATRTNFDGSSRKEARFVRWNSGFGCHYAAGFVFDDRGNDVYRTDWAGIGFGWDFGIGAVSDFAGNDRYFSGKSGLAEARRDAVAILFDASGNDFYSREEPVESNRNFAFLMDDQRKD